MTINDAIGDNLFSLASTAHMAEFSPNIAPQILAAAQAGATEASLALSRALDGKLDLKVGETAKWDANTTGASLAGPGLAILLKVDAANAAVVVIPENSGLLPSWYTAPDPTGISKLATLAQELGMLLLPEDLMPSDFSAGFVPDIAAALARGGLANEAGQLSLELVGEGKSGPMLLLWPVPSADAVLKTAEAATAKAAESLSTQTQPASTAQESADLEFDRLPGHMRSLLRIKVAVSVTLAAKKISVKEIVEMVPGAIIQFSKPCDEMLDLEARGLRIAQGECVKVGDKFGIRVTSITLPEERFRKVA